MGTICPKRLFTKEIGFTQDEFERTDSRARLPDEHEAEGAHDHETPGPPPDSCFMADIDEQELPPELEIGLQVHRDC